MKALIIGGAGFVGGYLADHLHNQCKWSVSVTKMPHETISVDETIQVYDLNILDIDSVITLLNQLRPDYIFHLAAQSSVALSWKNPNLTIDVNIKGSIHVLDAIRSVEHYDPRILLIGSGEEYGHIQPDETPIAEKNVLRPGNIYAATKACQNMIGKIYSDAYHMNIISVRAFNHIGPKQNPMFVLPDFCKQVAEIEAGLREPIIYVGNLSAKRDFTDVRDVVNAYALLMKHGQRGETYNVGSGHAIAIQDILDMILEHSTANISVKTDPQKLRPVDVPIIEADVQKLKDCTGWEPKYSIKDTIFDVLDEWRELPK